MDRKKALDIYNDCMNMDLSQMQDVIQEAETPEEQAFYVQLYNFVLESRQEKVVADGLY